jgi:hypothetical protein
VEVTKKLISADKDSQGMLVELTFDWDFSEVEVRENVSKEE